MVKTFTVPRGEMSTSNEELFLSEVPKRVIVGMVDNDVFHGNFKKSPFHFKHYSLDFAALFLDGQQIPSQALQPNFAEGTYVRCYQTLFGAVGKFGQDEGNAVTMKEYPQGYTLLCFDLTPDLEDDGHFNPIKEGNIRLELQFAAGLPNTINVIVLAEFENVIQISQDRKVAKNFTE